MVMGSGFVAFLSRCRTRNARGVTCSARTAAHACIYQGKGRFDEARSALKRREVPGRDARATAQIANTDAVRERGKAAGVVLAITDEGIARQDDARIEASERVDQAHDAGSFVCAIEADVCVDAGRQRAGAARLREAPELRYSVLRDQLMLADVVREISPAQGH